MRNPHDKWHDNWLVDTLLRLGLITLLTWLVITLAIYLGSMGELILPFACETLPEGKVTSTPPIE